MNIQSINNTLPQHFSGKTKKTQTDKESAGYEITESNIKDFSNATTATAMALLLTGAGLGTAVTCAPKDTNEEKVEVVKDKLPENAVITNIGDTVYINYNDFDNYYSKYINQK